MMRIFRRTRFPLPFTVCLCVVTTPAVTAAEILHADVVYDDQAYNVSFKVRLDAEPDDVRRIVTDHSQLTRLSPTIVKSDVVQAGPGGVTTIKLLLRPCIWIFCKQMTKVSDTQIVDGDLVYVADPQASDFHIARERLHIEGDTGTAHRSLVTYTARLQPKFAVPPLLGPWLIRRQILSDLTLTSERVEAFAGRTGDDAKSEGAHRAR